MFLKYVDKNKIKDFIKANICCCVDDPFESTKKCGSIELIFNCGMNENGEYREVHCFDEEIYLVNFNYSDYQYKNLKNQYRGTILENLPSDMANKYKNRLNLKKFDVVL